MNEWPTNRLGSLPIVRAGMEDSADAFVRLALERRGAGGRPFYSTSANGQVIALCEYDANFRLMTREADQIHADGMSVVLFSKLSSAEPLPERVATTDLVHAVAERAAQAGVSFYFLGASEEVNAQAVENMSKTYPGLRFAGRHNGYFDRAEEEAVVQAINAAAPDILWIGFGIPLEQQFVVRNINKLHNVGLIKTSGGLFDFLAGSKRRAPGWMQKIGLEWLYRMFLEPRRLARRYLTTNPVAIYAMLRHSLRALSTGR
ncbi:UDP-hexose transferase [Rhizobium sp. R72]|uniref:WecB/TagA/CpsF family glycosyltransferase n=1 Tax=unclassified Rhizobium TaxID=2613769 RepID=UPI000B52D347|nr:MULTISPECIES: WecB/TagA/CpsF family glycosyltransferase [unclassified Rhizobium]OWW04832.1 UDP-hexose transferase [Rhizobium sp. R72]OWW05889.1 UDP-hexose transferase [Rhizobium sp. R711]